MVSNPTLSEKIAEARVLKQELASQHATYNEQFNEQLKFLDRNPEISNPVKEKIKEQLRDVESTPIAPNKATIDQFAALKAGMQNLRREATQAAPQVDRQEESVHLASPSSN